VTWLLIAACVIVYFGFQSFDSANDQARLLYRRAAISCEITTGEPLSVSEIELGICEEGDSQPYFPEKGPYLAMLVSMFLHGGLGHLVFNMWFLWIFGNNVEEAFGHVRYLVLYVTGGVVATLAFVVLNIGSTVPLIGASGAIAAVLGAYAVLFPRHRVLSLLGWLLLPLPAAVFLGIWFFAQFGLGGSSTAWEAHVGGFVFGLAVAALFRQALLRRVPWAR
jgi:membrane associated rhomboid family serine protease